MKWLEKNLALLRIKDPETARKVEKAGTSGRNDYVVEETRNGQWTVKVRTEGDSFVYLHSRYNPTREAESIISQSETGQEEICIIYGTGIGYHIEALRKKINRRISYFIIEKDPALFRIWLGYSDLKEIISGNCIFCVDENPERILAKLDPFFWSISAHRDLSIYYRPITGLQALGLHDYYAELKKEISKETGTYVLNLNTMFRHALPIQSNICANMPVAVRHPGVKSLQGVLGKSPAIVVAAGPSLNNNIGLLKNAKGRIPIIAVDTALKSLLAHGVRPDIVTAIDYSWKNYEKLKDVDREGYYLASLLSVVPQTFEDFAGRAFIAYSTDTLYKWLCETVADKGVLPPGGSVVHLAYQLALGMGADPVIFTGLDLAYTGGATHSDNSIYHKDTVEEEKLKSFFKVEDVHGGTVYTPPNLWGIKTALERMIAGSKADAIDASEGGALIEGTEVAPLDKVLSRFSGAALDIQGILQEKYTAPPVEEAEKLLEGIEKMQKEFADIKKCSEDGSDACSRFKKQLKRKEYRSEKIREHIAAITENYERILEKNQLANIIGLLVLKVAYDHTVSFEALDPDGKVSKKEMVHEINEMDTFFKALVHSCGIYEDLLETAVSDLKES